MKLNVQDAIAAAREVIRAYDRRLQPNGRGRAVDTLDNVLRLVDPAWRAEVAQGSAEVRELLDQAAAEHEQVPT